MEEFYYIPLFIVTTSFITISLLSICDCIKPRTVGITVHEWVEAMSEM